jgi:DNA repair protein SbcC/Rad50
VRPVSLQIKGFTSFRDEQRVDFDGLDLFAISGPTGSGKSSMLDAITYALFGYVERVGRQCSQLISQGQPRMAVTLEFAVGQERFRVTRTTPAKGATKIQLERWEGEWRQAGEGSDRVKEVDATIRTAIGLDYDAFTRTVLLPQGRFAEFLVGDAKQRRSILTDLLGLELFERLAKHAGQIRRQADADANATTSLIQTQYAGVTPEAVAEAEATARAAAHTEQAFIDAEAEVRRVAERWSSTARTIEDLRTCERDLLEAWRTAKDAAEALQDVVARAAEIDATVKDRAKAVTSAERVSEKAIAAFTKAEASWGRAIELASLRGSAESLVAARSAATEAEEALEDSIASLGELESVEAEADERVTAAVATAQAALEGLEEAEASLEAARHADHVAAVRAGVHPGDDCPVCGARIAKLPRLARPKRLDHAQAALDRAKERARTAQRTLGEAERATAAAAAAVTAAKAQVARSETALARTRSDVARLEQALSEALGGKLPTDPLAVIDDRLAKLDGLEASVEAAATTLADARAALTAAERERDGVDTRVAAARGSLGSIAVVGLLDRARSLADGVPAAPAPLTGKEPAGTLATKSARLADVLRSSAAALAETAARLGEDEREVVREATKHLGGLIEHPIDADASTLAEVVEIAVAARTTASKDTAAAEERAVRARQDLANAEALVERVGEHRVRADVFGALAKELQANHLIAYLQVEALQLLAAAGSERLSTLSLGRYRLEYEDDEFSVIDTWNGEERRSARTLSGGETFLASLALALALSEQVRSLAVTDRARLDSLFLDEGFGTLDPDALEVVVEAIEQLGGDGRMVGVITHIQELAARLPAHIEIEKSPRGSVLRVAS